MVIGAWYLGETSENQEDFQSLDTNYDIYEEQEQIVADGRTFKLSSAILEAYSSEGPALKLR